MRQWVARWFWGAWQDKQRRFRVAGEYAALATSDHLLADLCIRNRVFLPTEPVPGAPPLTLFDVGVAEGRRQCVLEILELARVDPRAIAELEVQPARGERHVE